VFLTKFFPLGKTNAS
jgi:hypothetical protein